ncbi:myosin-M heavy chain-like [Watersipora subatra]|uniref:myosin-M heavy chain-like n=1 Tax=Watersipora subatra TaxID=2589382 RepID=UPI00355BF1DD
MFADDTNDSLLPTSMLSEQRRITVDDVIRKDRHLDKTLRRHSSPNNYESHPKMRQMKRRASSSPDGKRLLMVDTNLGLPISRRGSENLRHLRRHDSNISNISVESNGSNQSLKNELLDLSDEDFDLDFEIDLNSSKQSDTDSQKLFSQFQLETDSQKDSDSLAGYDEVDSSNCVHCDSVSTRPLHSTDSNHSFCTKCTSQNKERYETIKEILESELSYLKDLQLIQKHIHDILLENGLISSNDIAMVFGNIPQLIAVSQKFSSHLSQHLHHLESEGDDNYNNARIGQLICDSSAMFLAFEAYCLNYSNAVTTVDQLRKENQLLNLFLQASQNDNSALRRMDLKTFLMLPVQRVMKYPLLLKRLHKATRPSHSDRKSIEKANEKLTDILHHINAQSKVLSSLSVGTKDNTKPTKRTSFEIALTKLVLNTLNWRHDEIHFLNSGKLGYLQPADSQWAEKLRTLRLNTGYAVLVTKGKLDDLPKRAKEGRLIFPKSTTVTDAALLTVKKGNSRLQIVGEPYHLGQCLVSRNSEFYDVCEIARDYTKEPFIIRPVHASDKWYRNLKYYSMVLSGRNSCRRNALANILLQI